MSFRESPTSAIDGMTFSPRGPPDRGCQPYRSPGNGGRPLYHPQPKLLRIYQGGWLRSENRCLVPFNSFAEDPPEPNPETKTDVICFALSDERPLAAFAGIWTEFNGDRARVKTDLRPSPRLRFSHDVAKHCS
jgi:hypothetical protein